MDEYERIGVSAGFEVGRRGDVIVLAYRGTRAPALIAWIAGGLAFFALVHALLWPALGVTGSVSTIGGLVAGAILVPVFAALFVIARTGYRRYRYLRDCSIEDVPGYRADLAAGVLRNGERDLARLSEVTIDTPRNLGDSTQGSMRWVRLSWPGSSLRVYSAVASEAKRVADFLATEFDDAL